MKNLTKPEEFNLSRWGVPQLKELAPAKLHRFTQHILGTLAASRILMGRCLVAIDATGVYAEHGYSDSIHYAVSHGIGEREACEARRVATYLEDLPKLTQAAERGAVSWSALKAITPKASKDTEERWLELNEQTTVKTLEKIAARTGRGALPGEPDEGSNAEPAATTLTFRVSPQVAVLFQHAVRDLSLAMGRRVAANQALELLVVHFHTGAEHAGDAEVTKLLLEAGQDVEAMDEATNRELDDALDSPARANPTPTETVQGEPARPETVRAETDTWGNSVARDGDSLSAWAATVTKLLENPRDNHLKLVSGSRVRYNADSRTVTSAQRKQLLRRDGYCCSTPGCRRHLWLDVHHVVFYCRQGPTVPDNLVVVCQRCHKNIHQGSLRVEGRAPDRLGWFDREGQPLGRFRGYRFPRGLTRWFNREFPEPR